MESDHYKIKSTVKAEKHGNCHELRLHQTEKAHFIPMAS